MLRLTFHWIIVTLIVCVLSAIISSYFSGNNIQAVSGLDFDKLTNLVSLELRGNHLETTDGIYLPNLRRLYLVR